MLGQLLVNGLAAGCTLAILAAGLALIYNTTKILHIAHGAVYTVAAYACYSSLKLWHWPMWAAIGFSLISAVLLGILMELLVYAPLNKLRASTLTSLLASMGLYIAVVNTIALIPAFGNDTKQLLDTMQRSYTWGSITLTSMQGLQIATGALVLPLLLVWLRCTHAGRTVRAVRDNPLLVQSMGVNLGMVRLAVFALGSLLAGITSLLTALDSGMDPLAGMNAMLSAAVAMIIGGIGSFEGVILGALLLCGMQSVVIWKLSAKWVDAAAYLLLVLTLLLRPQGLLSTRRRLEEKL